MISFCMTTPALMFCPHSKRKLAHFYGGMLGIIIVLRFIREWVRNSKLWLWLPKPFVNQTQTSNPNQSLGLVLMSSSWYQPSPQTTTAAHFPFQPKFHGANWGSNGVVPSWDSFISLWRKEGDMGGVFIWRLRPSNPIMFLMTSSSVWFSRNFGMGLEWGGRIFLTSEECFTPNLFQIKL